MGHVVVLLSLSQPPYHLHWKCSFWHIQPSLTPPPLHDPFPPQITPLGLPLPLLEPILFCTLHFWDQNFLRNILFQTKVIWHQTNYGTNDFFGPNIFWHHKMFRTKNVFEPKILDPTFLGINIFLTTTFLEKNFF